ncbi:hypothetical protein ABSH91_001170 [Salmonella enterica]
MSYKIFTFPQITIFLIFFLICGHAIAEDYNYKSEFNSKTAKYVPSSATDSNGDGWFSDGPMAEAAVVLCGNGKKVSCSSPPWMDVESGIRLDQETRFNLTYQPFAYLNFTQQLSGGTVTVRGRCGDNAHLRSDNKAWMISCTWYGILDTKIILSPVNNTTIDSQTINLKLTSGGATLMTGFTIDGAIRGKTSLSSTPTQQTNQISDLYFQYQTYTHTINSCCNLTIFDDGYLTSYSSGISGNVDFSYTPESLSASFTENGETTTLTKNYEGEKKDFEIGQIWLHVNGKYCYHKEGSLCEFITQNSTANITCDSDNITVSLVEEKKSSASRIRNIMGTWGKVNIDTSCAITVTIPYE